MKPIMMSTEDVQAILDGRKTQTRRVLKPQPVIDAHGMWLWKDCRWMDGGLGFPASGIDDYAPRLPGDILWVRETFAQIRNIEVGHVDTFYAASKKDCDTVNSTYLCDDDGFETDRHIPWKPSIYMPREAARLFLRVTDVQVEQVQDINEEDAKAEGVIINDAVKVSSYRYWFKELWDDLNAKRGFGWDTNPWVWVYSFERVDKPAGWPNRDKGAVWD